MSFEYDSPPWITREFISSIKECNYLDVFACRVKTAEAKRLAKVARNRVTTLKHNLPKSFCQSAIVDAGSNRK